MGFERFKDDGDYMTNSAKRAGLELNGADVISAIQLTDAEPLHQRGVKLAEILSIPLEKARLLRKDWSWRTNSRKGEGTNGRASPPPAVQIGELGEAANMFREYQTLLDKKARIEEQLREVDSQLTKYQPIANVIQSVRTAVKNVKNDLEVLA